MTDEDEAQAKHHRFAVGSLALLFLLLGLAAFIVKDDSTLGLAQIQTFAHGRAWPNHGELPPDATNLPGDAYDSPGFAEEEETSQQESKELETETEIDIDNEESDQHEDHQDEHKNEDQHDDGIPEIAANLSVEEKVVSVTGATTQEDVSAVDFGKLSQAHREVLLSKLGVANSSTLSVEANGWNMQTGPEREERKFTVCNGTVQLKARSRIAVISISHRSDGLPEPRLHMKVTGRYMRIYAARVGADFHILQSLCAEEMTLHETMKALEVDEEKAHDLYANVDVAARARMQKLMAGTLLDVYDRILMLDDTVLVHPTSPDLFKIVPEGWLGAVFERQKTVPPYAKGWVTAVTRRFCAHYLRMKCDHMNNMFNSGVMLFDKSLQSSLFDARYFHKYSYVGGFYDQAYFNAMLVNHNIKIYDLGLSFNVVGSLIKSRKADQKRVFGLTNEQICMPHMTRMIKHRMATAKMFDAIYKRTIRTGKPMCKYQCGEYGCWVPRGPLPKPKKPFTVHTKPIHKGERWVRSAHRWIKS